jgi:hypothetical protein
MVEMVNNGYSVFNFEKSNLNDQLCYSLIHAYDPGEAIAEGKRIFINHIKNSIL